MSVPKAKALLTVCAALLLCGCGQALSEREIVRAVFFARQQGAYSACLLLADQNAESDGVQYKTASARRAPRPAEPANRRRTRKLRLLPAAQSHTRCQRGRQALHSRPPG